MFSSIDLQCFAISIDKNYLIAIDFYLLTTLGPPGCKCTLIYADVIALNVAIWPVTGQGFQNTKWPAVL